MPTRHRRSLEQRPARRAIAVAAALLVSGSAQPATAIWQGPSSDVSGLTWGDSQAWVRFKPGLGDDVLLRTYDTKLDLNQQFNILSARGSGTLSLAGDLSLSADSELGAINLISGHLNASTLTIPGMDNSGRYLPSYWRNTRLSNGVIEFKGELFITGAGPHRLDDATLFLAGNTFWDQGDIQLGSRSLNNQGTFHDLNNASLAITRPNGQAFSSFNNQGSYVKDGAGVTTIDTGFDNLAQGSVRLNAGTLVLTGANDMDQAGSWQVGSSATLRLEGDDRGTTSFAGDVQISGTLQVNTGALVLKGNSIWDGGGIRINNASTLTNQGDIRSFSDGVQAIRGAGAFVNAGRFTKDGGGTLQIQSSFNNQGSVMVNAGTLSLTRAEDVLSSGNWQVASGATISLDGSPNVTSFTLTGGGTLLFNRNSISWGAGDITLGEDTRVRSKGDLLDVSDTNHTMNGGNLSISTNYTKTGKGTTTLNSYISNSGNFRVNAGALVLQGDTLWTGATFNIHTGGTATNEGRFYSSGDGDKMLNGGPFLNKGEFTYSGTGSLRINSNFRNPGTLNITSGELNFAGQFDNSGGEVTLDGGILRLGALVGSGGTYHIARSSLVDLMSGGTLSDLHVDGQGQWILESGVPLLLQGKNSFTGVPIFLNDRSSLQLIDNNKLDMLFSQGGELSNSGQTRIEYSEWGDSLIQNFGQLTLGDTVFAGGDITINSGTLGFEGNTSWRAGNINTLDTTLSNRGVFWDRNDANVKLGNPANQSTTFSNDGTYTKHGAGRTDVYALFSNRGALDLSSGEMRLNYGLSNYADHTLTGGTYQLSGNSVLSWNDADIYTLSANVSLSNASRLVNLSNGKNALTNLRTINRTGSLSLLDGASLTLAQGLDNSGAVLVGNNSQLQLAGALKNTSGATIQLAGGTIGSRGLSNSGTISGFGQLLTGITNEGTVRATGGTLLINLGTSGSQGSLQADAGATLQLAAGGSTGTLLLNGGLNLGGKLTISQDYNNANFGVGNSFNRRAGVQGSGAITAAGTISQQLLGSLISNGNRVNPTLDFGAVRVGSGSSTSFQIANVGNGPSLRGALQTTGINNAALSGSGVTAQNWGALSAGTRSASYTINYNPLVAGSLGVQTLAIVNNFDNVAGQTLSITGSAWNLAQGSIATTPIQLAAQRVGGTGYATLQVDNVASKGSFTERLDASASASGAVSVTGTAKLINAGDNGKFWVSVDTSSSGLKTGALNVAYQSNGTGTSGLSAYDLGSQQVAVSGKVYAPAVAQVATPALDFGIVRVGDVVSRNITVRNAASGALTDSLSTTASIAGSVFNGGGFKSIAAGASQDFAVRLDTRAAGSFSGKANLAYRSHNAEMSDLDLARDNIGLSAIINQLAVADLQHSGAGQFSHRGNAYTLDFGTLRGGSGDLLAQLSLLNKVSGQADTLAGQWQVSTGSGFVLDGPFRFDGISAGSSLGSLGVRFDDQYSGVFDEVLVLKLFSTNASDPAGRALSDITLHLQGSVVAVPEPDTYLMLLGGLLLLGRRLRRRA